MPTMSTDGDHLFYDPDFVMSLPMEHLIGVMVHEVGHIALRHLARWQGRSPIRWNVAADLAINDLIVNTTDNNGNRSFQLPPDVLLNPDWHDQTAEWIYNKLPDDIDKKHWMTIANGKTLIRTVPVLLKNRSGKTASLKPRSMREPEASCRKMANGN